MVPKDTNFKILPFKLYPKSDKILQMEHQMK